MEGKPFRRVAVLKGGVSSERDVSLCSGAAVARGLREAGYEVTEVEVTNRQPAILPGVEAVFVALHGEFGEDGQVQALLDGLGLPYTGSGAASSQAAFDKIVSKRRFEQEQILTAPYEVLAKGQARRLPLPVVVKPVRQGSSIGIHRVFQESDWEAAARDAFTYGDDLLVERFIAGRELTVGIVGSRALPMIEVVAPDGWYDYRAKYTRGLTRYLVPAPLDEATTRRCQSAAMDTFRALNARGMARVDFRLSEQGEAFVLELNSIPGFTETSLLPKAAAACGLSFPELCDQIMRMARCG